MKRKGEQDQYFRFECAFFGGVDRCRRFQMPLARKGWDRSCDKFQQHEVYRKDRTEEVPA